jgi:hypothetical protein
MSHRLPVGPLVLWLVASAAVSVAGARISVWIQSHFAPVVLYPVLFGGIIGAALAGLAYAAGLRRLTGLIVAVVLLAIAAALLEHAFFYADYRASFELARQRGEERIGLPLPDVEAETFGGYLRSHAEKSGYDIALWLANPLITATAAGVVFWYLMRPRR